MSQISSHEIKQVILESDDFGHEMRVGSCLSKMRAYKYSHGGTYVDSVTGKPRQYDFRAVFEKEYYRIQLAIECKNIGVNSPLVVCGTTRNEAEAYHHFIDSRNGQFTDKGITKIGATSTTYKVVGNQGFYPAGKFVGKSLLRMKMDKNLTSISDADIYDRWSQALSSCVELAQKACTAGHELKISHLFTVILPVVVVPDGSLWKVVYDGDGNISSNPEKTDESEFFVDRHIDISSDYQMLQIFTHDYGFSHIHFFTLGGFNSFLSKLAINPMVIDQLFYEKAHQI